MSVRFNRYHARFLPVLRHIEQHLERAFSVSELADLACCSPFHFQRQFRALFGLSVYQYLQLLRWKQASYRLAFRTEQSITDIGFSAGFQNSESFSRAFRQLSGQSPRQFRQQPDWLPWHEQLIPLSQMRSQNMQLASSNFADEYGSSIRLVDFPATRVAVLEHRGEPRTLGDSIRRFISWRKANGLPPHRYATFNLLYDDPNGIAADAFRFDLCVAIDRPLPANGDGIIEKCLPAGRCAVLRHTGTDESLAVAVNYLYHQWLPESGEHPRDFPLFLQRLKFFPEVPEHEAVVDIFLPLN